MSTIDELPAASRALEGAIYGGIGAALCVAIGIVRVVMALLFGARIEELRSRDLIVLSAYVGGFLAAGAILGVLAPMRATRLGALLMGLIGAGTVCSAFGFAIAASESRRELAGTVFAVMLCTLIFGAVLARDLYKSRPPAA